MHTESQWRGGGLPCCLRWAVTPCVLGLGPQPFRRSCSGLVLPGVEGDCFRSFFRWDYLDIVLVTLTDCGSKLLGWCPSSARSFQALAVQPGGQGEWWCCLGMQCFDLTGSHVVVAWLSNGGCQLLRVCDRLLPSEFVDPLSE